MKKIFTVGVYDLLHIGHIKLFEHAKQLGNHLIVAVQDADVVLRYKPNAKMVYSTNERIYMVRSIRYVDDVIVYRDVDTIVKEVDFDVFAVGPDQNHAGFQAAIQWCRDHGREVVVIPRTDGISSTQLREGLD